MTLGLAFWIIMLIWVVLRWPWANAPWPAWSGDIVLFILFLLLGWHDFGPPLHG